MSVDTLLERLGLSKTEARVYLCLLEQSPMSAAAIADVTGTSRSSVYLVLRNLVDKGLIDAGAGYSSRYHASPPDRALVGLIEHERRELDERAQHVHLALPMLTELFGKTKADDGEIVEVLRTPKLVGERFDRLQSQARESIDIVVRGPIQVGGPNEAEVEALRRGVQARAIYDRAVMDDPTVVRHLGTWIRSGEQARLYPAHLPMKFAVFDARSVLMPMSTPGAPGVLALIVRSVELAAALGFLFDTLWAGSHPLPHPAAGGPAAAAPPAVEVEAQRGSGVPGPGEEVPAS